MTGHCLLPSTSLSTTHESVLSLLTLVTVSQSHPMNYVSIPTQHSCYGQDRYLEPPLLLPWKLFSMSSWKVFPVRNLVMRSRASQMG